MQRALILALLFLGCGALPSAAQTATTAALRTLYARPETVPFPAENAYTAEREILGRTLFFDPRLSTSNRLSCASCHNPSFGWSDGQALGRGNAVVQLDRRSPTILNAAWGRSFFWDGRAATLETQATAPIEAEDEMNMPLADLPEKLAAIPGYRPLFAAAYPDELITVGVITRALATFERGIVSGRSPFDRWVEGDDQALTASERRGLDVFAGPAHCANCHTGWNFTDGKFHDTGLPSNDVGRARVLPDIPSARYAFKTPSLSDTRRRAPYMHDGSLPTLEAVVRFYETGWKPRPSLSPLMQPVRLSDAQRTDLLHFMDALTAPPEEFATPALPR